MFCMVILQCFHVHVLHFVNSEVHSYSFLQVKSRNFPFCYIHTIKSNLLQAHKVIENLNINKERIKKNETFKDLSVTNNFINQINSKYLFLHKYSHVLAPQGDKP